MANLLKIENLDDFPLSPRGSVSSQEFYQIFLQCEELADALPKKELGGDRDHAVYGLMKEIYSTQAAAPALFRKKVDAQEALTRLWLSRVRESAQIFSAWHPVPPGKDLTKNDLVNLAKLSANVETLPKMAEILLEFGVLLIHQPSIPGMKIDGAAFLLGTGHPVVALSLRYSRLDYYWFTLMHELSHVVLHREQLAVPIVDDLDEDRAELLEMQADRLASDSLISRSDWRSSNVKYSPSEEAIKKFAVKVGVHPSIVAGRLRRELDRHDLFSKLVNSVNVRKVLWGNE